MGGWTEVHLKNKSLANIRKQNALLRQYGVKRALSFYSDDDIQSEFDGFRKGTGHFPEDQFPRDKIKSLEDFKEYWNPKRWGSSMIPHIGQLSFDCYFGRTSRNAMRNIGRYIADNHNEIESVNGSWSTFVERGMTKREQEIIKGSNIKERNY